MSQEEKEEAGIGLDAIPDTRFTDPAKIEKIFGQVSTNVRLCGDGCSGCQEFWYSDKPDNVMHECVDNVIYKYARKCDPETDDTSLCGINDLCHHSWPSNTNPNV